jgi:hypothetical protein
MGSRAFQLYHGIDLREVAARLSRKPTVRVSEAYFVARYMNEEYTLAPVRNGLTMAMGKLLSLCTFTAADMISLEASGSRSLGAV